MNKLSVTLPEGFRRTVASWEAPWCHRLIEGLIVDDLDMLRS
jgi:hypothetical protein